MNEKKKTNKKKKKRNERSNLGSWPSLPNDLLVTIAELLTSPDGTDFFTFGAVCRSWRSAAAKVTHNLVRQMPWIMLPALNNSKEIGIYNPSENKSYNFRLPKNKWIHVCGSVSGWVAIELRKQILVVNLNPFTRQHPRVRRLPPLDDPITYSVRKLCLPLNPTEDPNGMAVAIYGYGEKDTNFLPHIRNGLAFAKLGSQAWAIISSIWAPYNDAVLYKGRFYAVSYSGVVVELYLKRRKVVEIAKLPFSHEYYLVESAGDLLGVQHYTSGFNVFKLDFSRGEWEVVRSLGERSLFVGRLSYSISVAANELFMCMSNCIYSLEEDKNNGKTTMVVYNLAKDKNIEIQTIAPFKNFTSSPLWVSPFVAWHKSDDPSGNI